MTESPGNEDKHYQGDIQPIEFIEAQQFDFLEGSLIKYISRYPQKGGLEDLLKAQWYLERLIVRWKKRLFLKATGEG